ncbi:unnamed protein product [Dovyalis caffra]|uniref:BZIP domain-containing protein n=1 Tax=Dovyalis caffra TaxID=77055 RepID=A0AAV1RGA2_9ROSI|nr:unnamed protein product [Dovyalis caffra]
MLSSINREGTSYNNKTKSLNRVSSSLSSKSSSTSSSPSPFSPSDNLHFLAHQNAKTMEEVWKDISLASLHDHTSTDQDLSMTPRLPDISHHHRHHHSNNPNFILQDFLARPFNKDPPTRMLSVISDSTPFGSSVPPPATVLSLNSGPGFDFLDNSDHPLRKRPQESDISSGDRRHKRMIKNRESAARSRARKQESPSLFEDSLVFMLCVLQAYTNELELEVAHLSEENARLKKQQQETRIA